MAAVCGKIQLVIVDLDTSGLFDRENAEVLGIAALSNSSKFLRYIMPLNEVPKSASAINNLWVRRSRLYYGDEEISETVSQRDALEGLLQYLRDFKRPCVLIAHYCPFHCNFLMRMIIAENLEREFAEVVAGFTDTWRMFRNEFPEKPSGFDLKTIVAQCSLPTENVRQARHDVDLLQDVAYRHFARREFVENMMNFASALRIFRETGQLKEMPPSLNVANQ